MKKTILALLIAMSSIHANDIPVLKAGQNISADQLNEIITLLEKSTPDIKASDLVGSYVCRNYAVNSFTGSTASPDGLYNYQDYDVTFNDDNDGTFSWTRDLQLVGASGSTDAETIEYEIGMSMFYSKPRSSSGTEYYRIVQDGNSYKFYEEVSSNYPVNFKCTNTNLLSPIATDLTSAVTNDSVTLTWVDNSTDETGFKVLRKDSLTGSYSVIDTVGQDETSYTDDALADGTYWYRIQTTNSNGDSLGSNVTKVVIAN